MTAKPRPRRRGVAFRVRSGERMSTPRRNRWYGVRIDATPGPIMLKYHVASKPSTILRRLTSVPIAETFMALGCSDVMGAGVASIQAPYQSIIPGADTRSSCVSGMQRPSDWSEKPHRWLSSPQLIRNVQRYRPEARSSWRSMDAPRSVSNISFSKRLTSGKASNKSRIGE